MLLPDPCAYNALTCLWLHTCVRLCAFLHTYIQASSASRVVASTVIPAASLTERLSSDPTLAWHAHHPPPPHTAVAVAAAAVGGWMWMIAVVAVAAAAVVVVHLLPSGTGAGVVLLSPPHLLGVSALLTPTVAATITEAVLPLPLAAVLAAAAAPVAITD